MNESIDMNNRVTLAGRVVQAPEYSHDLHGDRFYDMRLAVPRLSGQEDVIPVTLYEDQLRSGDFDIDCKVAVQGQFRSYNKPVDVHKSKLMLTVFARKILSFDEHVNENSLEMTGYICKPTVYRVTPFKREICDMFLAVNRPNYNRSDYIPCIVWGHAARFAANLSIGTCVQINGRIQSREYQKKLPDDTIDIRTAYEVSVFKISTLSDGRTLTKTDESAGNTIDFRVR